MPTYGPFVAYNAATGAPSGAGAIGRVYASEAVDPNCLSPLTVTYDGQSVDQITTGVGGYVGPITTAEQGARWKSGSLPPIPLYVAGGTGPHAGTHATGAADPIAPASIGAATAADLTALQNGAERLYTIYWDPTLAGGAGDWPNLPHPTDPPGHYTGYRFDADGYSAATDPATKFTILPRWRYKPAPGVVPA